MNDQAQFVERLTGETRTLYAFAYSLVRNHQDSEEIVQKTSVIMWKKYETYDENASFGAWSRSILYRVAMNHLRSRKREAVLCEPAILEKLSEGYEQVEDVYRENSLLDGLQACLSRLTGKSRRMIELRYKDRKTSADIGKIFRLSISAVDVALYRLRSHLEQCMKSVMSEQECES